MAVLILYLPVQTLAQSCCDQPQCREQAQAFVDQISPLIKTLGEDPDIFEDRQIILDSLRIHEGRLFNRMVNGIKDLEKWFGTDGDKRNCFFDLLLVSDTVTAAWQLDWIGHIVKRLDDSDFGSPEFCREWGLHLDLNQGVADPFGSSEAYLLSTRALISYTLSPTDSCGGRFRLMLGPSLYYSKEKAHLFINPRVEIRLMDIGNNMTNVGNIKAIAQGNIGDRFIGGLGLGVELANFNLQILGEYHDTDHDYSIQVGIGYRFSL